MITILYVKLDKLWKVNELDRYLSLLPFVLRQKISLYKDKKEQQIRILGKLMLLQLLNDSGATKDYGLIDIAYDKYNKPFFKENFHFSIAHSEDFVVCAASKQTQLGIDAEKIKPINVQLLKDIFSPEEWLTLDQKDYDLNYFYFLWTRKEAVLKAIGKGVVEEMEKIEVLKDIILYKSQQYTIYDLPIHNDYKIALASNVQATFEVKEFVTTTILNGQ